LFALGVCLVPVRAQGQLYMYRGRDGRIMFAKAPAVAHEDASSTAGSARATLPQPDEREAQALPGATHSAGVDSPVGNLNADAPAGTVNATWRAASTLVTVRGDVEHVVPELVKAADARLR
jgi:hypothetical protein